MIRILTPGILAVILFLAQPLEAQEQDKEDSTMGEMCMKMCMDMMHGNMMKGGMDMESDMRETADLRSDISDDFKKEFTELIRIYLSLKDALVESDLQKATDLAAEAEHQLEAIGENRLEGDAQENWQQTWNNLMEHLEPMTASGDLDEFRIQFREISGILVEAVKSFGIEGVVYHQHCPMKKAEWLSSEEKIQNPYMPETMPGCGEVIERID